MADNGQMEQMRREAVLAASVAASKGFDIRHVDRVMKAQCHTVARAALAGANQLIAQETAQLTSRVTQGIAQAQLEAQRKAYDDGFNDGMQGEYANQWGITEDEESWPDEMG